VAFLGGTRYGDATVSEEGATPETAGGKYRVSSTSQYAGVPFYNHSSLGECGKDYWQVMGGAVARYTRNDRLWWLFGVVFDDSDFGTSVLPYMGASLTLSERWSVSAILPWP
jgi:hypothetical protein